MQQVFKKYTGGLALMFSVLFLLIGITKYDQIFTSTKYDAIKSAEYIKTAISQKQTATSTPEENKKFNIVDEGEIIKINETPNGELIQHYRSIYVPELINNYEHIPQLQLEIIDGSQKELIDADIYKINREKGLIFFLLKLEKNHQTVLTNIYTGNYEITLIN